jgi:phosphatidylethanolamine-binding protein (PEBP) family uncharacterized protein
MATIASLAWAQQFKLKMKLPPFDRANLGAVFLIAIGLWMNSAHAASQTGFTLSSPAFSDGEPIPQQFTADGQGPFTHWLVYGISAKNNGLPAAQGKNSESSDGCTPPNPPKRDVAHHYHFKLFALDRTLILQPGLSENQVLSAIKGHVIAETQLVGLYGGTS